MCTVVFPHLSLMLWWKNMKYNCLKSCLCPSCSWFVLLRAAVEWKQLKTNWIISTVLCDPGCMTCDYCELTVHQWSLMVFISSDCDVTCSFSCMWIEKEKSCWMLLDVALVFVNFPWCFCNPVVLTFRAVTVQNDPVTITSVLFMALDCLILVVEVVDWLWGRVSCGLRLNLKQISAFFKMLSSAYLSRPLTMIALSFIIFVNLSGH